MRKIDPYKTLAGALRALDNGGRFYNLFTQAGDKVVSATELKKVAGVFRDDQAAALFFELATAELDERARRGVMDALGPEARAIQRRHRPLRLEPAEFAAQARAGVGYLVEGRVRKFDDVTVTGMIFIPIMVGKTMTMMMVPTQDYFTVYELDGPAPGVECLVLTPKQNAQMIGRHRFSGIAKEAEVGTGKRKIKRLRLEPQYYTPIGR